MKVKIDDLELNEYTNSSTNEAIAAEIQKCISDPSFIKRELRKKIDKVCTSEDIMQIVRGCIFDNLSENVARYAAAAVKDIVYNETHSYMWQYVNKQLHSLLKQEVHDVFLELTSGDKNQLYDKIVESASKTATHQATIRLVANMTKELKQLLSEGQE